MNDMRKLMETVSAVYENEMPETPQEIIQELKTTYKKHFRGTGADIWEVEDGWAIVGWASGSGDSEFVCFRKAAEGYETTRAYYSDGANVMKIFEDEIEVVPTLEAALDHHWG